MSRFPTLTSRKPSPTSSTLSSISTKMFSKNSATVLTEKTQVVSQALSEAISEESAKAAEKEEVSIKLLDNLILQNI